MNAADVQGDAAPEQDGKPAGLMLKGLSHAEAMQTVVPPSSALVEDVVECGTVGTISGLPETWKSAVGVELAAKVATGAGKLLGRFAVVKSGPVGYFWQDDSRENELRRLQTYSHRHGHHDAAIRWYLNEGLALPAHIALLRAEVEQHKFGLVILDSLYNFLPGVKLRDEEVGLLLARVKAEVCDPTGVTLAFIDHAPWPTEGNAGQRRGFGSVFKRAATRWSLFLEREGGSASGKVTVSANNLTGLATSVVVWDAEAMELRLLETMRSAASPASELELADRVVDFLGRNFGAHTTQITASVEGRAVDIRGVLGSDARITRVPSAMVGRSKNAVCYGLASDLQARFREGTL